jgi:hypothetical protein
MSNHIRKFKVKIRRKIQNLKIKTKLFRNLHTKPKSIIHLSAREKAYAKFGRDFFSRIKPLAFNGRNERRYYFGKDLPNYESKHTLTITCEPKVRYFLPTITLSWLSLGFEKKSLIIEGMQTRTDSKKWLNEFRRATKKQAIDFMLEKAEERARELGFEQIKIRKPEFLYWYQNASVPYGKTKKQVQRQIKILYQKIALKYGYKIENNFYVKELR